MTFSYENHTLDLVLTRSCLSLSPVGVYRDTVEKHSTFQFNKIVVLKLWWIAEVVPGNDHCRWL